MTFFWIIAYNALFLPLAFIGILIYALFNQKMHRGLVGRQMMWKQLKRFRDRYPAKTVYLIHSASLGEFEQAKPVIRGLKALRPDIGLVASFTSPSGYDHAERIPEVDLFTYLPFDGFFRTQGFIRKLKPRKIIFVTYELWPNLIFNARRHRVPTYLISARVREKSLKTIPLARLFFRSLYRSLDYIFAISEKDRQSVRELIGSVPVKLLTLGDTRYDQVLQRTRDRIQKRYQPLFKQGFTIIIGSIWPQDARHLMPALFRIMREVRELNVILAPHEPHEYALEGFEEEFKEARFRSVRYSRLGQTRSPERVVLVDRIGILAELYHQGQLAFVGGGFRGSVHNVMEPAVAGIPVLFGPHYHNSREAELLIEKGGGASCRDEEELYLILRKMVFDQEEYRRMAAAARQVILDNLGASARTVKEILESS